MARHVVQRHRARFARDAEARDALTHERPISVDPIEGYDEALWAAWRRLREADREVLSLIAWEELSVAGAARSLGCSAPVFSVRLHRARRRLEVTILGHPPTAAEQRLLIDLLRYAGSASSSSSPTRVR